KLQKEDTAAVETFTPPLEFSPDNSYINRNKSEKAVNKLSSADMDISNNYKPVDTDIETYMDGYEELVKKYLQVEQPYKVHRNTTHSTPVTSNQH
ncbi:15323_t:CDS:2, partial [Gigaspora margarita]